MTKDIKERKSNFKFENKRQKQMVKNYIREFINNKIKKKDIVKYLQEKLNISACDTTIKVWIRNETCRMSGDFERRQAYMEKVKLEYKEEKPTLTPEEVQLEDMYKLAKERSGSNEV